MNSISPSTLVMENTQRTFPKLFHLLWLNKEVEWTKPTAGIGKLSFLSDCHRSRQSTMKVFE